MNIIYAYKKKSSNKVVYVGQTTNLEYRHKQHILYDPYNQNNREYNYPLSRGIRKYGPDEYELLILEENLSAKELDKQEKYWVEYYDTYYHGYNQTLGGKIPVKPIFDEELVSLIIDLLKEPDISLQEICNKTQVSMTHIYNINVGKRRRRDDISYPIRSNKVKGTRGLKFSQIEAKEIHELLLHSHKTFKEISSLYHCNQATISNINKGKTKAYRLDGYAYPLRQK